MEVKKNNIKHCQSGADISSPGTCSYLSPFVWLNPLNLSVYSLKIMSRKSLVFQLVCHLDTVYHIMHWRHSTIYLAWRYKLLLILISCFWTCLNNVLELLYLIKRVFRRIRFKVNSSKISFTKEKYRIKRYSKHVALSS